MTTKNADGEDLGNDLAADLIAAFAGLLDARRRTDWPRYSFFMAALAKGGLDVRWRTSPDTSMELGSGSAVSPDDAVHRVPGDHDDRGTQKLEVTE